MATGGGGAPLPLAGRGRGGGDKARSALGIHPTPSPSPSSCRRRVFDTTGGEHRRARLMVRAYPLPEPVHRPRIVGEDLLVALRRQAGREGAEGIVEVPVRVVGGEQQAVPA